MRKGTISVVVPVFNGAQTLDDLFHRTQEVMAGLGMDFQVIYVDDRSPDNSWEEIERLKVLYPKHVKAIRLAKNAGQHNATLCGIHHSTGDFIVTIDDDLQIPPEEIPKLLQQRDDSGADLVYGVFKDKHHSYWRNAGSYMVNKFFYLFANTNGGGSSFRLITRELADHLKTLHQKYLLLDEVLSWYTNSVSSVTVEHYPRTKGQSGYSFFKLVLLTLNYVINYTVIPLRFMTWVGMLGALVTFVLSIYYIYDKLFNAVELGFTSLIVAVFFSTSLILFSLGIIGEYISRLFVRDGSPHYIVKEVK